MFLINRKVVFIFFFAYLLTGIYIFRDYGVSWDEQPMRTIIGLPNYEAVFHHDRTSLEASPGKYYGPIWEIVLIAGERALDLNSMRSIWLMRHLLNFLLFYASSIAIYAIGKKLSGQNSWGLITALFYIVSPRLFGESFYNSKDIVHLSFLSLSLYSLLRLVSTPSFTNALLHAITTGLLIDTRLTGIVIPIATLFFLPWLFFFSDLKTNRIRFLFIMLLYAVAQIGTIILFWPVLWSQPSHHFMLAFAEMSHYPWNGAMLYLGKIVFSTRLPWHYLPVWMLISIPAAYIFFFCIGCIQVPVQFLKNIKSLENNFIGLAWLLFFIPLGSIVFLHAVVYDGWRHVYFLYAPFVIIAVEGLKQLTSALYKVIGGRVGWHQLLVAICVITFSIPLYRITCDHPLESVYFNEPSKAVFAPISSQFEMDYWGLSFRSAFESILEQDTSSIIDIQLKDGPSESNWYILTDEQRGRIRLSESECKSRYRFGDYRGVAPCQPKTGSTSLSISNASGLLLPAYKERRVDCEEITLLKLEEGFESTLKGARLSAKTAHTGKQSNEIKQPDQYGYTLRHQLSCDLNDRLSLDIKAWINAEKKNPDLRLIFSVDRMDSAIVWREQRLIGLINASNTWLETIWRPSCEESLKKGDRISVYFSNTDRQSIYVDDIRLTITQEIKKQYHNLGAD